MSMYPLGAFTPLWLFTNLLLLPSLLVFPSPLVVGADASTAEPELLARATQLADEFCKQHEAPAVSFAVGDGDGRIDAVALGQSDLEHRVPTTIATVFRTASIAKPITAAAIMQLVEQGKLSLDDPIDAHCPEFPRGAPRPTIRHLLCHQGGIRHYRSRDEASGTQSFPDIAASLALFKDDALLFEPGTQYHYTTYGYSLLGRAVETASGESFRDYLQAHIFAPSGMERAGLDDTIRIIPDRARGYLIIGFKTYFQLPPAQRSQVRIGQLLNCTLHDTSMKVPGGGLICSPTDLVKFGQALLSGQLLRRETRELAWQSQATADGTDTGYGLGWRILEINGRRHITHSGSQAGTSTMLVILPEAPLVVAVMSNLQGAPTGKLAFAIAEQYGRSPR